MSIALLLAFMLQAGDPKPLQPLVPVPFTAVRLEDAFWKPCLEVNRTVTLEANLKKCEETGRIRNFAVAGKLCEGKHEGALYNDSDVYKVLEGAAYALHLERDAALEARVDAIIDQIAAAQQPDGYLNTYFTLVEPGKRFTNIRHGHELYCAGHLVEAAVAYFQATGKRKLLDVALRLVDCIDANFGPGKKLEPCGHEEIELALMKLHRVTGDAKHAKLAKWFIDQRGNTEGRESFGEYAQDHVPFRQQTRVVGHAVRAMYLYCGAADVAAAFDDRTLLAPLETIWTDLVWSKMYLTGGIGSSAENEGFEKEFVLPNDTAYCETCAAIGMALWNHRMFLLTRAAKYADAMERELYNNVLAGVSAEGDRFFYANPLASKGDVHRVPWFDCSCCPTNLVRFLPAVGERMYATRGNELYVALYAQSEADVEVDAGRVGVRQETRYPWGGRVALTLTPERPMAITLKLRLPSWLEEAPRAVVRRGDETLDEVVPVVALANDRDDFRRASWLELRRTWQAGDVVELTLSMDPRRVRARHEVEADRGRVALQRGPIVYAFESCANGPLRDSVLPSAAKLSMVGSVGHCPYPVMLVSVPKGAGPSLLAVPYFHWDNGPPGEMAVWMMESAPAGESAK